MPDILSHQENAYQNDVEILSCTMAQVTAHAGEEVKQGEYSSIAGGLKTFSSHSENPVLLGCQLQSNVAL